MRGGCGMILTELVWLIYNDNGLCWPKSSLSIEQTLRRALVAMQRHVVSDGELTWGVVDQRGTLGLRYEASVGSELSPELWMWCELGKLVSSPCLWIGVYHRVSGDQLATNQHQLALIAHDSNLGIGLSTNPWPIFYYLRLCLARSWPMREVVTYDFSYWTSRS